MDQTNQDRKALESLVVNNADLERLEALLDRFNIFEAVGLVRQEIRHSAFLAFLLDPQENHGLDDAFAKRLLQGAIMSAPEASAPVTPIELSLWDLGEMEVWREWQHIDIFLLDERNRLAVIIENKIDTSEHSDQLQRYYEIVKQHYPDYRIIGLYLTLAGDEPSHDNYLPLGYGLVCEVLDSLAQSRASVTNADLQILVTHYTQMLKRHIVGDSEIARLCRQIYQKHQQALDLIFEHRFAEQEAIRGIITKLIREAPSLIYNTRFTHYPAGEWISFRVQQWETPSMKVADGGAYKECILLFVFSNLQNRLDLNLQIGTGDEETRERLLHIAHGNETTFKNAAESLRGETTIFSRTILSSEFYEDATNKDLAAEIRRQWTEFLENDLPRIDAALKNEAWIWESDEA